MKLFFVLLLACLAAADVSYDLRSLLGVAKAPKKDVREDKMDCPTSGLLACPAGFTGSMCDITLCDNRGIVALPHEDIGFEIDIQVYKHICEDTVPVPVDSHVNTIYILLDAKEANSTPQIQFMNRFGQIIVPSRVIATTDKTLITEYDVSMRPAGMFKAAIMARTPCVYRVHADTDITIPVSFVKGERAMHNDHGHARMYAGDMNFAIMHGNRLPSPGMIKHIQVFADADLMMTYKPSIRYGCGYEVFFGPIMCEVGTVYYYKAIGLDENGFKLQRTDTIPCEQGQFSIVTQPGTPPPNSPCANGGIFDHGNCYCGDMWTGDFCQNIVCMNGGTPDDDMDGCECLENFGDMHCQSPMCQIQSQIPIFSPNGRSIAFVVQNTMSMQDEILALKEYITSIIEDFVQNHPYFIAQYSLVTFDDMGAQTLIVTSDPLYIMEFVHHIVPSNVTGACNKRALLGVMHALASGLRYGSVYVITDSPDAHDNTQTAAVVHVLGLTKSKVNVFLTSPRCGSMTDLGYEVLQNIADYSTGQLYMTSDDHNGIFQLLQVIQTAYEDTLVNVRMQADCTMMQTIHIQVDSRTASFSVSVAGNMPMVTLYTPDGMMWDGSINLVNDPSLMTLQAIQGCGNGWAQYDHNCYMAGLVPKSWRDAQDACEDMGGTLVSLLNQEKQSFINKEMNGMDYWTGLNDIDNEGAYYWDVRGPAMAVGHWFLSWGPGQPSDATHTKNCVAVLHMNSTVMWYNKACTDQLPYVCQKHAYDNDHGNGMDDLPKGVWRADYMTMNSTNNACRATAHAQSDLQVFFGFGDDLFHDYPNDEPYFNMDDNRVVANVSMLMGMATFQQTRLLMADFHPINGLGMMRRTKCSYDYVSEPFTCPGHYFDMLMTGTDDMGHPWRRMRGALCFNATEKARNAEKAKQVLATIKLPAKI